MITSNDVPPVLTAPSASQSAFAGVSTSINLGTLAVTGVGPFTDTVQWGDGQTSTFSPTSSGPLSLAHTYATAGTYTIGETVSEYDGGSTTASFSISVTQEPTSTMLDLVDGLRGLRPVADLHGHRDRPGGPDGHRGVLRRPGHTGRSDRHRHAERGERPVRGHLQHQRRSRPAAVRTRSRRSMAAMPTTWAAHQTSSARRSPRPTR